MAPKNATDPELLRLGSLGYNISTGDGRSRSKQAGFQLAALMTTLCFAIIGGVITGLIMRLGVFLPPRDRDEELFEDEQHWDINPGAPEVEEVASPMELSIRGSVSSGPDLRHRLSSTMTQLSTA